MSDMQGSRRVLSKVCRNGKAPLLLMLNQHLMTFLGAAFTHVWNAGEPMQRGVRVRRFTALWRAVGYGLWIELQPDPAALSEPWRFSHSWTDWFSLWSDGYIEWCVQLRAAVHVPLGFERPLAFDGSDWGKKHCDMG